MTPAPPPSSKDDAIDVSEMLDETEVATEGINLDDVDSDFEQELEDLFSDDLEEDEAAAEEAESNEPIMLDDLAEEMEDPVFEADDDVDEAALEAIVQPATEDDDLILLDEVVEETDVEEPLAASGEDLSALVEDIAEEPADQEDEEDVILLDDLAIEEPAISDLTDEPEQEVADLDALLEEVEDDAPVSDPHELPDEEDEDIMLLDDVVIEEDAADVSEEILLEEVVEEPAAETAEEISFEPEDMMDAALAEAEEAEVPVEEAVADEELELLMDEPEAETPEVEEPVLANGEDDSELAELAGLDELEGDDMEDMDSLLDNVEVDVSDITDAGTELDEGELADTTLGSGGLGDMLAAEAMPADAGIDVSEDVNVDELLADVNGDAEKPTVESLQSKVAMLEARVEDLETRLRDEIAQMVPAEAARIIREEIAALAQELDD